MKKIWTVISLDDATGEVVAHRAKAEDPHEAMRVTAWRLRDAGGDHQIIGALAIGVSHELVPPCEDSRKAAHVADLLEDTCRKCGKLAPMGGDGWDGLCGFCAQLVPPGE